MDHHKDLPPSPQGKKVLIEFVGGPRDSEFIAHDSPHPWDRVHAQFIWAATSGGVVGRRTIGGSPFGIEMIREMGPDARPQAHYYDVMERLEEPNEILIRLKYVGTENKPA